MNRYGELARSHWARWLPVRYGQIPDPQVYFTDLGREGERQIGDLMLDLAGQDPPGEDYLAKAARLSQARRQAEEMVLAELILLPPEPQISDEDSQTAGPPSVPATVTRDHPMWEQINAEQTERLQGS